MDIVVLVVIAVDSSTEENETYVKGFHKASRIKNPFTGAMSRGLSVAAPFDPLAFAPLSEEQMTTAISAAFIEFIKQPNLKIHKAFDFQLFSQDMVAAVKELNWLR